MKLKQDNAVLRNLRDAVDRIVDNCNFDEIERSAQAKLVNIVVEMMYSMSSTCRDLLENAGRTAKSVNPIDIKFLLRLHRIEARDLIEYAQEVGTFPPNFQQDEIHRDANDSTGIVEKFRKKKRKSIEKRKSASLRAQKNSTSSKFKLPIFDDLDDLALGFTRNVPPPPAPVAPPLSPVSVATFSASEAVDSSIPTASTPIIIEPPASEEPVEPPVEVPPPPLFLTPPPIAPTVTLRVSPNFVTRDERMRIQAAKIAEKLREREKRAEKVDAPVATPTIIVAPPISVAPVAPPAPPAPVPVSIPTFQPRAISKKKQIHRNYERRLREEQNALEERMKERKAARASAERDRLWRESQEKQQKVEFRVENEESEKKKRGRKRKWDHVEKSTSSDSIAPTGDRKPLPRFKIRFRKATRGFLIKTCETIKYRLRDGLWHPKVKSWRLPPKGVVSQVHTPRKTKVRRLNGSEPIPKLRLLRKADGSIRFASSLKIDRK